MILGFSTGALYGSGLLTKTCLSIFKNLGCNAVELNFVRAKGLLENFEATALEDALRGFVHVSFHAPVLIRYGAPDSETREIFARIDDLHRIRPLDLVVFHPETVVDFQPFTEVDFPVAFENMDNRKASCKNAEDIARILSLSEKFRFVLDVNHVFTNDETLRLANEFYERCGARLSQIHLSGYSGYHEPLYLTQQAQIIRAIRSPNVPIIIESVVSPDTIQKELDYIGQILKVATE